MANCFLTQGTVIEIEDNELTPAFQVIGDVISFTLADAESSDIDVTTLASSAKEYCVGLQDRGNLTLEIIRDFDDAGQVEMEDAKNLQQTRNFRITLPNTAATTLTFAGNVKSFTIEGAQDDVIRSSATIKISGNITIT